MYYTTISISLLVRYSWGLESVLWAWAFFEFYGLGLSTWS